MRGWPRISNEHLTSPPPVPPLIQPQLFTMKLRPQLISWQCNISILRLLSMPYVLWYWAHNVRLNPEYPWIDHCISGLVFVPILLLNDVFMIFIDRQRTDTYLGCVVTQVVVNFCLSVLVVLHIVLDAQWYLPISFEYYPISAAFEIFVMIVGLCSLCLMGISLSSILALRSCVPVRQLWKANTKDAFKGVTSPTASPHTLTLFGRPRETKIPLSGPFVVVCRVIKMRFTYLLFRRIKPVETRLYAFARNSFAIVAIGILIFRTATALQRAQNEIGTRVISRTCDDALPSPYISILSDRLIYDTEFGTAHSDVNVSVSIVWPTTIGGYNDESAISAIYNRH
ncbi:unnamed protein product [Rhizoctonia solani]|uniref:Transmembrane protein n=1 Tax=Rhizoctonia solani TaxID=456999 RepID=A0A8H3CT28_9AGAM|nr:unnamed protein product [Rhizoctonia solani]